MILRDIPGGNLRVFKHLRLGYVSEMHLDSLDKISFTDATEEMVSFNLLKERYEESVEELPESISVKQSGEPVSKGRRDSNHNPKGL